MGYKISGTKGKYQVIGRKVVARAKVSVKVDRPAL
jgi:hypothetical protein